MRADRALHGGAADQQRDRIEIALHGEMRLQRRARETRRHGRVERDGVDTAFRRVALIKQPGAARETR